jgi:hypothetical protein
VAEARQTRIAIARLLGQVAIDADPSAATSARTMHARRAARARWQPPGDAA